MAPVCPLDAGGPVEEEEAMAISVLLVDDEEVFIQTLAKRLTLRRFNVYTATRRERVFESLRNNLIDIVLLDVRMPDLDGIEATQDIKVAYPLIEVILLTGHASMEASLEGLKRGAFDYLLKPVNIDELVYKIEDAYRKKGLQEEKIRRLEDRSDQAADEAESGASD
jgi:DNA-binding NtrC family response regulator